jgi:NarL family two-component system response regulator LiaR
MDGCSNQDMADKLIISPETVKTHMRHIMEKLMVSDRTQAAVKAMRAGLFRSEGLN